MSKIGKIDQNKWLKTFEMQADMNLWMGEYIVIPNHVHGIVEIAKNDEPNVETQYFAPLPDNEMKNKKREKHRKKFR